MYMCGCLDCRAGLPSKSCCRYYRIAPIEVSTESCCWLHPKTCQYIHLPVMALRYPARKKNAPCWIVWIWGSGGASVRYGSSTQHTGLRLPPVRFKGLVWDQPAILVLVQLIERDSGYTFLRSIILSYLVLSCFSNSELIQTCCCITCNEMRCYATRLTTDNCRMLLLLEVVRRPAWKQRGQDGRRRMQARTKL